MDEKQKAMGDALVGAGCAITSAVIAAFFAVVILLMVFAVLFG